MKKTISVVPGSVNSKYLKYLGKTIPPIIVRDGKMPVQFCNELIIFGQDGKEAARVVYHPDAPIQGGTVVWIETENDIELS